MAEIETQDGRNGSAHTLKSKREFSQKAIKKSRNLNGDCDLMTTNS
ncbi:hypothetical protein [Segatella maculosa]|nr:hypothetical protein [Segatella maculosa]